MAVNTDHLAKKTTLTNLDKMLASMGTGAESTKRMVNYFVRNLGEDLTYADIITYFSDIRNLAGLFPHIFYHEFASIHHEMFDLMTQLPQYLAVAAPRGIAKSTVFSFLWFVYSLCFGIDKYSIIVSGTADQSIMFLQKLRSQIIENDLLREIFGIKVISESKTVLEFETPSGRSYSQSKGRHQRIRGRGYREFRPTLLMLDDAETEDCVNTEEQREKFWSWFWDEVMPAIDRRSGRVWVIGTVLHKASALNRLLDHDSFISRRWAITDKNGNPIWPEMYSKKDIRDIQRMYEQANNIDGFYREYYNRPIAPENQKFKPEYLKFYKVDDIMRRLNKLFVFMLCDLNYTKKKNSDKTSLCILAVDPDGGDIYVLDMIARSMDTAEQIDEIMAAYAKWRPYGLGIEDVGFQFSISVPLKEEARKRGLMIDPVPLKTHGQRKPIRIMGLLPYFKQGKIHFPDDKPPWFFDFLSEYREFEADRDNEQDDMLDSMAYLPEMLEQRPIRIRYREDKVEKWRFGLGKARRRRYF